MNQDLIERLLAAADAEADGHLTILKFTTNWRVAFFTPADRDDIEAMPAGDTFEDAAEAALRLYGRT